MPQPSDLIFALPDGSELVSGGNIYNARLIQALRALVPVETLGIDACRRRVGRGDPGRYVIDSLNLRGILDFPPRLPGQSFILVVHHLPTLEPDHDPRGQAAQAEPAALARFDTLVATSPFTAGYLVGRGHAARRILTLPPALDPAPATATPAERPDEAPLRALVVGNLIPRKGMVQLFTALDARLAPHDALVIDVVGRDDIDESYARRCRDLTGNSPRLAPIVRYHGGVAPARMTGHYQAAHVLVSAARLETFGMALQEARGHGLPIVALDGGHVRHQFTDGEDGLLFFNCATLADGLLDLARDAGRARALLARAQQRRQRDRPTWADAAHQFLHQLAAAAP